MRVGSSSPPENTIMKLCGSCKKEKPIEEFAKNKSKKDGYANTCKICKRKQQNLWYQNHRQAQRHRIATNSRKYIEECRDLVYNYLLEHPCVDCGETNPIVLQFDHQRDKEYEVSDLMRNVNKDRLMLEIQKCEVRCANCHLIIESKRSNSWRYKRASFT